MKAEGTDTKKTNDSRFVLEMKESFIPLVETLLVKEQNHLKFLNDSKEKFKNTNPFPNYLFHIGRISTDITKMIDQSEKNILHYQNRLKAYKDYIIKIEKSLYDISITN